MGKLVSNTASKSIGATFSVGVSPSIKKSNFAAIGWTFAIKDSNALRS